MNWCDYSNNNCQLKQRKEVLKIENYKPKIIMCRNWQVKIEAGYV